MERLEATIVLKAMELRMVEAVHAQIEKIQEDTEAAVKQAIAEFDFDAAIGAIAEFDFDAAIGEVINKWLEDKIESVSTNMLDSEMFNIEPELTRTILRTPANSLRERG